jgi:hypothetical protein
MSWFSKKKEPLKSKVLSEQVQVASSDGVTQTRTIVTTRGKVIEHSPVFPALKEHMTRPNGVTRSTGGYIPLSKTPETTIASQEPQDDVLGSILTGVALGELMASEDSLGPQQSDDFSGGGGDFGGGGASGDF